MLSTYLLRDASHRPSFTDRAIALENVYLSSSATPSLPRTITPSWRWLCFLKHSSAHCYWESHNDVQLCRAVTVLCRYQHWTVLLSCTAQLLNKKFSAFDAPCRFIMTFTPAHCLSLFEARLNQSMLYHPTLKIHFNIILPPTSRCSKCPGIWLTHTLSNTHTHTHTQVPVVKIFSLCDQFWQIRTRPRGHNFVSSVPLSVQLSSILHLVCLVATEIFALLWYYTPWRWERGTDRQDSHSITTAILHCVTSQKSRDLRSLTLHVSNEILLQHFNVLYASKNVCMLWK
jgi:hypothetical protein